MNYKCLLILLSIFVLGMSCEKQSAKTCDTKKAIKILNAFKNQNFCSTSKNRAEDALKKWKANKVESSPDLIWAEIRKPLGLDHHSLVIFVSEVRCGIQGIGIVERVKDGNSLTNIQEEIPVLKFVSPGVSWYSIPITFRKASEKNDANCWTDPNNYSQLLIIGKPDPNIRSVSIYLYDSVGAKSNYIELKPPKK